MALVKFLVLLSGCGASSDSATCDPTWFASRVVSTSYGPGQSFGRDAMPRIVLGSPKGGGCCQGSLDVVSLGNGGSIVLGFDRVIEDGPGADFVVFENAFDAPGGVFAELATVSVSEDGADWKTFSCNASSAPYGSCAGWHPVLLNGGCEAAVDPATAGGDPFDLAAVGVARARFVRITDRADLDGINGYFDLDAVGIVHGRGP